MLQPLTQHELDLVAELEALIANPQTRYNLEYDFSRRMADLTGRPESSVLAVLRHEREYVEAELKGRGKYERALVSACDSLLRFYVQGNQWAVDDLVGFVESHRYACVWGVLARHHADKNSPRAQGARLFHGLDNVL